jgi:oligopeptide transport system ATP-binding protein
VNGQLLLEVRDLRKTFPASRGRLFGPRREATVAVDGVSFQLGAGETLGIVGESGSGKTTTAQLVLRLIRPTSGSVRFMGTELTALKGEALRALRREFQIVFQNPYASLDPRMRVADIVQEPLEAHGIGTRQTRRRAAAELLDRVGIDPALAHRRPRDFSGGQRQRIAIARALALRPKLIVCDEPVSALDVSIQAQILNLLRDLQGEMGVAYLFISHDIGVVRVMSDRIAVMREGKVVETGPADTVHGSPREEYTRSLLAAVPVADPALMAERRAIRAAARRPTSGGVDPRLRA